MEARQIADTQPGQWRDRALSLARALLQECNNGLADHYLVIDPKPIEPEMAKLRMRAKREYTMRRLRTRDFGGYKFGSEPSWDMLLDLFATAGEGGSLRTTSVCIASAVPPTTALRHLGLLETAGLIWSGPDPSDARVRSVRLTPKAIEMMCEYLSRDI